MQKHYLYLLSAAFLLLASGSISAATIEMNYSKTNGQTVNYTINGTVRDGDKWWTGQFSPVHLDFDSDSSTWTPDYTTISYCVDLLQFTTGNADQYDVELQSAVGKGDNYRNAAWLMNMFSSLISSAAEMAGLQVAIWEVIYDHNNHSLSGGNFNVQSTGSVVTNANNYLATLNAALIANLPGTFDGLDHYRVAYNPDKQDQLIATPIPMAVWLFGSGLLGMLGFRKRATEV